MEDPVLSGVPGLEDALRGFVGDTIPLSYFRERAQRPPFEMERYRQHILDLAEGCVVHFDGVSPLIDDPRLDRVYRFVTAVFMQHNGEISLEQDHGREILILGQ